MRPRSQGFVTAALALLIATLPMLGLAAPGMHAWQAGPGAYESPQFGYVVEWGEQWAERERETISDVGGADSMVLSNNEGRVQVVGQADDVSVDEALDEMIAMFGDAAEVVSDNRDGDVPSVELATDRERMLLEGQTVDGAVVVVTLRARDDDYETALTAAQDGITLNGTAVLTGEPAQPTGEAQEPTEEPVEPTEEPDDPTEEPSESTEEPGASGLDGTTYTSEEHEFSVAWDDAWEATENGGGTSDFHELRLTASTGSILILSGPFYDGDPETCLAGENAYFSGEDPTVEDWAPAVDAAGAPVTGSGDNLAWGVFTFTYASEDEGPIDLVDYIECRALAPGETILEILVSSRPDQYEAHMAAALAITNAIEMPEGAAVDPVEPPVPDFSAQAAPSDGTPETEGTPISIATPGAEASPAMNEAPGTSGESGLDGATFTSPSFGWSLEVPEGWTVENESIAAGDETLVISNGLSTISLHATDAYSGDLPGCIGFARNLLAEDPRYEDLRLDATVSGEAFQGADDRSAFALFSYTGPDDERRAHFVDCRYIVPEESVLIVSQDVPYDQYPAERLARRQIQRAIEFP